MSCKLTSHYNEPITLFSFITRNDQLFYKLNIRKAVFLVIEYRPNMKET